METQLKEKRKRIMFAHKLYKQFMGDDTKDDVQERERQERLLAVVKDNTKKIDNAGMINLLMDELDDKKVAEENAVAKEKAEAAEDDQEK